MDGFEKSAWVRVPRMTLEYWIDSLRARNDADGCSDDPEFEDILLDDMRRIAASTPEEG